MIPYICPTVDYMLYLQLKVKLLYAVFVDAHERD
jgi:hypothetical protein